MSSKPHTDPIHVQQSKPKGDIKFKISLEAEQKLAKSSILEYPYTLLKGMAGSGKTLLACQVALSMLFKKDLKRIVITRPTVSKEDIGFLPGDLKEKMDPWLAPIYANLYMLYDKVKIDKLFLEGTIEIIPFAFMRGRTFTDSFIIVDECQNLTHSQTEMIIGRLGVGSRMVFCGDSSQIDLKYRKDSGISFFNRLEERSDNVKIITLLKNHRHEAVQELLKIYEEFRD